MGKVLKQFNKIDVLSFLKANDALIEGVRPQYFNSFISRQLKNVVENHRRWKTLPEHLILQLTDFLPKTSEELLSKSNLAFIHADLHDEHLFVKLDPSKTTLRVTGIIDFNDCAYGDRLYELILIHLPTFHTNKNLLKRLVDELGWEEAKDSRDFAYRCACYCLLHQYNVLSSVEEGFLIDCMNLKTLNEFATLVWDFEDPNPAPLLMVQARRVATNICMEN